MTQGLITLYVSDIVRLLGTLGLLSLGIALALWGLKRHRSGAVMIALFLCLVALVPVALAQIELPPAGSVAQIQTNGPNGELNWGDWYTSDDPGAGDRDHSFQIYVPCTIDPAEPITVELFDPESYDDDPGGQIDLDEIEPAVGSEDDTTFTLLAPDGVTLVQTRTYTEGTTSQDWDTFATFDSGTYGCGIYRLTTSTSDDDQQGWKLRVTPDNPDGTAGTGDEISLGTLETSFQHTSPGCQVFHFLVPDMPEPRSIRLSNFDMDGNISVVYTDTSGTRYDGSVSGRTVWNNGGGVGYPPPGGDVFPDPGRGFPEPEPGWWQAELCANINNQYVFDTGGIPYFYNRPAVPDMTVSKDDGTATFSPGGVLTYTIIYTNTGLGAALDVVLTDTLPLYTNFVSCGDVSCGEIPPGSGVVIFQLGTVISGASGSVWVSVDVDPGAPTGTMTNTVELDYTDIVFSDYPPETDIDVDQYEAPTPNPGIEIAKTVYLGHDSGAGCPGSEIVVGTNGAHVTYCFEVTNTGNTYLDSIVITDTLLGIPPAAVVLLSGATPLAPGNSLVYYYEGTVSGDLVNTAQTEGNPTDPNGNDLDGLDDPTAADDAAVAIEAPAPTPEPSEPEPSDPGAPAPPPPAPPPAAPAAPTPTPTVEALAVARLPETGGFPGWFTVLLGVPIIIGAAGLLNLALLETRGRRGDGKGADRLGTR